MVQTGKQLTTILRLFQHFHSTFPEICNRTKQIILITTHNDMKRNKKQPLKWLVIFEQPTNTSLLLNKIGCRRVQWLRGWAVVM